MRHFTKASASNWFEEWKKSENQLRELAFSDLQNPQKDKLLQALISEQAWLCCYCGKAIDAPTSHLEHFRPQDTYPDRALDYANLHASCMKMPPAKNAKHCGHQKGNWFDEQLYLSPNASGCEARFTYTLNGQIRAANDTDAQASKMIEVLKLDHTTLQAERSQVLQNVFDVDFLTSATDPELRRLIDAFRTIGTEGKATPFGHVVAQFA